MIIFYHKKSREIFGVIEGRVHDKFVLKNGLIKPKKTPKKDIGKYVVPFKTKYRLVEQPKTEMRVVDKETMRVETVVVGKEKVKQGAGMTPDVPFADKILEFEKKSTEIYKYKVKVKKGKVIGFEKK